MKYEYASAVPTAIAAFRATGPVTRAQFASDVARVALALPNAQWIVNRCANRYHFAVAFEAVCRRGSTNLLPPGVGVEAATELLGSYAGAYWWRMRPLRRHSQHPHRQKFPKRGLRMRIWQRWYSPPAARANRNRIASPGGHWPGPRGFCRLRLGDEPMNVVVTVPQQHMYGLETSIFTMLAGDWALHDGNAFYPDEIARALAALPAPRLLITAPYHLRHLLASSVALPKIDRVLSATAPLPAELAREAEQRLGAQVFEIYGCTEAGSMATRRTAIEELWSPYPGLVFAVNDGATSVRASHLDGEIAVGDRIDLRPDGRFSLLGRDADMIKIGGRRGSLADIAAKIAALSGVTDQVVFMPTEGETARPAALVVAPGRDAASLRRELGSSLEAVFLPRPLRVVAALPRNPLGKLPRAELLAMLEAARPQDAGNNDG